MTPKVSSFKFQFNFLEALTYIVLKHTSYMGHPHLYVIGHSHSQRCALPLDLLRFRRELRETDRCDSPPINQFGDSDAG